MTLLFNILLLYLSLLQRQLEPSSARIWAGQRYALTHILQAFFHVQGSLSLNLQQNLFAPSPTLPLDTSQPATSKAKLWLPGEVFFTKSALDEPFGQAIHTRLTDLGVNVTELTTDRLPSIRGKDERETYRRAKKTLAVVVAPPSQMTLQPIPPSADYQFHLAQGCPAHCQYCYLAGSLGGPPLTRVYANLPDILENLKRYKEAGKVTTFEASCYTDPLALEHLTGSLSETITFFGQQEDMHLRWVSKFDNVEPLLALAHNGHTRARLSMNALPISQRLEGGTASLEARLAALRKLAQRGYPVGIVLAPIMPIENWREHYTHLFQRIAATLNFPCDLTFELITHRFTEKSKGVLNEWYPNSPLDMSEEKRTKKRNAFGGLKFIYTKDVMRELREFFEGELSGRFPAANILYWT
jgi:spore photoproduct lyase